ncbi:MAG: endonuclease [Muribaculum sp.]|nr:endonuclease [Muribaculum sp.]
MRRAIIILPLIIMGISASVHAVAEVPFNGKSGLALRNALYEIYHATRQWDIAQFDAIVYDTFNGRTLKVTAGVLPGGYCWGSLVQDEWWDYEPEIQARVKADFYNHIPIDIEVKTYRKDLTPGKVTEPVFENEFWKMGRGLIYGTLTDLYSPPLALRGKLARTFFYIAVMYPSSVWTPRGFMMMHTGNYPVFNAYAIGLLMEWHKSYPVTDSEREGNDMGEKLQGNRNPFIDFPDLPDYLWGDRAGDSFVVAGEPVPLRGRYKISDERIDLMSPHVPADAVWKIDGIQAQSTQYKPSDLGCGKHELQFRSTSTGEHGYITILIE